MSAPPTFPRNTVQSGCVDINAPRSHVWSVLTDFAAYPDWNPFTFRVDAPAGLHLDVHVYLHVRMNAKHRRVQQEVVRLLEPGYRLGWSPVYPTWFIRGMRVQQLNEITEASCRYHTYESFGGLVVRVFGPDVERGLNDVCQALKVRAEATWPPQHA